MAPEWIEFVPGCRLPPRDRFVLVELRVLNEDGSDSPSYRASAIAVGYLKFGGGDVESPYFVCHSVDCRWRVLAYADCLGDDFIRRGFHEATANVNARAH